MTKHKQSVDAIDQTGSRGAASAAANMRVQQPLQAPPTSSNNSAQAQQPIGAASPVDQVSLSDEAHGTHGQQGHHAQQASGQQTQELNQLEQDDPNLTSAISADGLDASTVLGDSSLVSALQSGGDLSTTQIINMINGLSPDTKSQTQA